MSLTIDFFWGYMPNTCCAYFLAFLMFLCLPVTVLWLLFTSTSIKQCPHIFLFSPKSPFFIWDLYDGVYCYDLGNGSFFHPSNSMKELYCFLYFILNEKQLLETTPARRFCPSLSIMHPHPHGNHLSEWNSDFEIWPLQGSEELRNKLFALAGYIKGKRSDYGVRNVVLQKEL